MKTAFRAALRRQPYFGAAPRHPEVLCVEDMTPAIARAEAVIRKTQETPVPPPVVVFDGGANGSQRIASLSEDEAERLLRTDSILVLDEYAFKYPAGRLDHFLALLTEAPAAPRPSLTRRGIVGRLAVALLAPVILVAVFAAGMGVGRSSRGGVSAKGATTDVAAAFPAPRKSNR